MNNLPRTYQLPPMPERTSSSTAGLPACGPHVLGMVIRAERKMLACYRRHRCVRSSGFVNKRDRRAKHHGGQHLRWAWRWYKLTH